MILPFWNSELYVEVSSWFPFGKDYYPVSLNRFYSESLKTLSGLLMDLDSEFLFMASPEIGCVGNLPRENFFKYIPDTTLNLGFLLVLGYSEPAEKAVIASLGLTGAAKDLAAGIAACYIWSRGIYQGRTKVIAVASYEPFYNADEYLKALVKMLDEIKTRTGAGNASYYAERFGYDRFFVAWEKDSPFEVWTNLALGDFEYDQTKEITGGDSMRTFPPFLGTAVSMKEIPAEQ